MYSVLFLCYNNGGRSQMAEALFNAKAEATGVDAHAESAGVLGVGATSALIVRCMEDSGVSLQGSKPKVVTKDMVEHADTVITFDLTVSEHRDVRFDAAEPWQVDDPAGVSLGRLREIRDEISSQIDQLLSRVANPT